ncbi:MAG: DUF2110 family protein [Candidatus Heimdallarchaeaceae archaeon]
MIKITTLIKNYNVPNHSTKKALEFILHDEFHELDIEIKNITFTKEGYAELLIEGEDEQIVENYLQRTYGTKRSIADMQVGDIVYGRFLKTDQVNFGLFVEVGAITTTRNIDALFPLYEQRKQLAQNKTVPMKKIVRAYGIVENLPLFFEITEKQIIGAKLKVKLTEESLDWLTKPIREKKEALIITGTSTRMIKEVLKKTNHSQDIDIIERIGVLEHRLICKKGTRAEGLIPEIGYLLKGAKLGAQIPSRVQELLSA